MKFKWAGLFAVPMESTVHEKCSCGAELRTTGMLAASTSDMWRNGHPCPNRATYGHPRPTAKSVSSQPKTPQPAPGKRD